MENDKYPALSSLPYQKRIDLVLETAQQVRKDFDLFNINIQLSGSPEKAYGELIDQMTGPIEALRENSPMLFSEMLYRIDVDERILGHLLADSENKESTSHDFAQLIIEREFRKVLTRHLYKANRLF